MSRIWMIKYDGEYLSQVHFKLLHLMQELRPEQADLGQLSVLLFILSDFAL